MRGDAGKVRGQLKRVERVDAVVSWLRPFAAPVASEAEFARWISARNADPEQSESWCTRCAKVEVDRLNNLHPDAEYLVDGGWGSDTDNPRYCCKCEKTLSDHLTRYAIGEEVDHYSRHSVRLRGSCSAERAFRFIEVFESQNFDADDKESWLFFRKVERMFQRRQAAAAAAAAAAAKSVARNQEGKTDADELGR